MGLSDGEEIVTLALSVLIQYRLGQTDGQTRCYSVARVKTKHIQVINTVNKSETVEIVEGRLETKLQETQCIL